MSSDAKNATADLAPIRIVLIGDSTVADYGEDSTQAGWGQMLGARLSDKATVVNLAQGGRSSKSFLAEGLWDKALAEKGNFILIQFGHNDSPGKAERTTDPRTTYPQNLRRYVVESRKAGAIPILITPMERRKFTPEGRIAPSLAAYAEAMRKIAAQEQVALVDLHSKSIALYERLGPQRADAELGCGDQTHFSPQGADAMACLVAEDLARVEPRLAPYIKPPREG